MSNIEDNQAPRQRTKLRVPCSARPTDWDLDTGGPQEWQQAIETCRQCPVLAQCSDLAQGFTTAGMEPRGVIWAGVPYDDRGRIVVDLNQHKNSLVLRGPTRISRRTVGASPFHRPICESFEVTKVKGVHLTIRRRSHIRALPDTGTSD
ncbi:WhiB family transcriptional regulator [Nocardia sp. NPDC052278]|uniref:WhiB family transcriptional regulator n=1 Tax=unclassified Nocardia TaxID=2637762 RepID=UPI003694289A